MVDETGPVFPFGGVLFPHILRSFRMAIQPSKLIIAFTAVTAICLIGRLMDLAWMLVLDSPPFDPAGPGVFRSLWTTAHDEMLSATTPLLRLDVFTFLGGSVQGLNRCAGAFVGAFTRHPVYSVVFFAAVLVIWSWAGGAICRMTALEFARGERIGFGQALRFSRKRLPSLIAAPIAPLAIALLLGLPIILLGALGNVPYVGELLTGLLLPLALTLAPFIAVVLIGAVAGLNLLFPAIAYEDSDFFDAIGRSFSSVYARPWRMGFYTLVAIVYGAVCYLFVRFFTFVLLWVTRGFLQLGLRDVKLQAIWPEPGFDNLVGTAAAAPETWSLWLSALLIRIWVLAVAGLVVSFTISFYFSAGTIIYALMRNRVDGTPLDEVYKGSEEATSEPAQADASGPAQSPPPADGTSE